MKQISGHHPGSEKSPKPYHNPLSALKYYEDTLMKLRMKLITPFVLYY
jgi:hypothetical protein